MTTNSTQWLDRLEDGAIPNQTTPANVNEFVSLSATEERKRLKDDMS